MLYREMLDNNTDNQPEEEIYYEVLAGSEIYKSGESYMTKKKELPVDLHPSGINDKSVRRRKVRRSE